MRHLEWIVLTIIIIGAINWGLVGFFQFDLIAAIFGGMTTWVSRLLYAVVGLSGLYALSIYGRLSHDNEVKKELIK